MTDIAILSAKRTAIGAFNGTLAGVPAPQLAGHVITSALAQAGLESGAVDDVVLGHVLCGNVGQGPARQAAVAAGIPQDKTAYTLNQVCGSGLRAVMLGAQSILSGDAQVVVAGGMENMSLSPHAAHMRAGTKMGDVGFVDTMIKDGLWDAFNNYHMGITAENVAQQYQITRAMQDELALSSQNKAEAAIKAGHFAAEIAPYTIKGKKEDIIFAQDEFPRFGATMEALAKLRPAFKPDGTVTAGNASGINDGAAVVVLMRASEAVKRNLKPLATIKSWATAGVDPALMGTGPIPASRKALQKAGWTVADLDLIEANEAFAAQAAAVNKEMGWDIARVNVNGGAIALGHPIGASGCRVLVTLLHAMAARGAKKGLATLCVGGGMGVALTVER